MFEGKVVSIDSRIDPATRAVIVRAVVPNRDAALKPGMFLTVDLSKERRDALLVPEEALVPEQARQFVYVVDGVTWSPSAKCAWAGASRVPWRSPRALSQVTAW